MQAPAEPQRLLSPAAAVGLVVGLCALLATITVPPPAGVPPAGWRTLGLALMMAIWWSTEPLPIGITALMPLIVLPLLGVAEIDAAAAPYANPLVFLFLGGFLLAAGVKRWGLHKRLAHTIVRFVGSEPRLLILGFMAAVGFLSMWISNTAAVVLMLPVAVSVISTAEEVQEAPEHQRRFAVALLLGLAYAASIGGVGTLIGTPPNALLAGYLRERHGIDLSFAVWSAVAMPLVATFLPLAWLVLTRLIYPIPATLAVALREGEPLESLTTHGPLSPAERRVALIFCVTAGLWITRPLLNKLPGFEGLSDPGIALICGCALFLVPSGEAPHNRFLMSWEEAKDIPWQVLLLFGGGLSLASAMDSSGLAAWIGQGIAGLGGVPPLLFLLLLTATVVMLTELVSNTATVAALLPVVATVATATGMDVIVVSAAVAMAASCAFMLPVATPPNALVFATGHVTVVAMMRAGLVMNLLSIVLVSFAAFMLAPLLPGRN
jgi:sodium-dependent dicarboxylate transporter 2/3/5